MDLSPLLSAIVALPAGAVIGVGVWRHLARKANEARLAAEIAEAKARSAAEMAAFQTRLADGLAKEKERLAAEQRAAEVALAARSTEARTRAEADLAGERQQIATQQQQLADREARVARSEAKAASLDAAVAAREDALSKRSESLDKRAETLESRDVKVREREAALAGREAALDQRGAALDERERSIAERLAAVAGLTREQAREELLAKLDQELIAESSVRIGKVEKQLIERAKELAIEHVSRAIQRYAAEHTAESTFTRVPIGDDEMKGRIIGKEGRNIKAFEQATGVDVVIDETPGHVTVSCFDPVRREIARRTLVILVEDGRIQPGRIEEVQAQVTQELDREIQRLGEDAAVACEVSGLHPQLIRLLGKLHFRTSYGQNVLKHTQEVSFLCGALAADLGLDPRLGRRCGLLHDIGKAIDHEQEGSHPELGYEALKRWGESETVANAALAHHEGHEVKTAYTVLAAAADAISAARPGARVHSQEKYVQRLQQLEEIACAQPGVQKAFAIQAGRELRVIVNQHQVPDEALARIARDIARRIADEVAFPGEVKVTMIRETRVFAVAR